MKKVLITGASSGFGLLSSISLAKKGYEVIATMRNLERSKELKELAKKEKVSEKIHIYEMDITKMDEIKNVKGQIELRFKTIDILINNAGYAQGGFFNELTMEVWQEQFNTNFFGHIQVTKEFLPLLRKHHDCKIINISSISGYFGFPGLSPYTSSKHALEGWSESLRLELMQDGIWVSLIEPASYQTNIWQKGVEKIPLIENRPSYQEKIIEQAKSNSDNSGDPTEVVKVIEKVCSTRKPKLRYPVGKGTKKLYICKSLLPWNIIEWVVRKKLK